MNANMLIPSRLRVGATTRTKVPAKENSSVPDERRSVVRVVPAGGVSATAVSKYCALKSSTFEHQENFSRSLVER